jgi:Zn-dependent protease
MAKEYEIGRIFGLRLSVVPKFFTGTILLWLVVGGGSLLLLEINFIQAFLVGLVTALLYWVSNIFHHLGHAYAARRTGYPMAGIRMGTLLFLSTSLYPDDEGQLPGAIHIRRALGGPVVSILLGIIVGILGLILYPVADLVGRVAFFVSLINLFVFGLGAFMPLGFTDGSTLLEWWGKR